MVFFFFFRKTIEKTATCLSSLPSLLLPTIIVFLLFIPFVLFPSTKYDSYSTERGLIDDDGYGEPLDLQ